MCHCVRAAAAPSASRPVVANVISNLHAPPTQPFCTNVPAPVGRPKVPLWPTGTCALLHRRLQPLGVQVPAAKRGLRPAPFRRACTRSHPRAQALPAGLAAVRRASQWQARRHLPPRCAVCALSPHESAPLRFASLSVAAPPPPGGPIASFRLGRTAGRRPWRVVPREGVVKSSTPATDLTTPSRGTCPIAVAPADGAPCAASGALSRSPSRLGGGSAMLGRSEAAAGRLGRSSAFFSHCAAAERRQVGTGGGGLDDAPLRRYSWRATTDRAAAGRGERDFALIAPWLHKVTRHNRAGRAISSRRVSEHGPFCTRFVALHSPRRLPGGSRAAGAGARAGEAPGRASGASALVGSRALARHGEGGTWRRTAVSLTTIAAALVGGSAKARGRLAWRISEPSPPNAPLDRAAPLSRPSLATRSRPRRPRHEAAGPRRSQRRIRRPHGP